jgi:hypothetical protein
MLRKHAKNKHYEIWAAFCAVNCPDKLELRSAESHLGSGMAADEYQRIPFSVPALSNHILHFIVADDQVFLLSC